MLWAVLGTVLFGVGYYKKPACKCDGQGNGSKCQNDCQCKTCKGEKGKNGHKCSADCSNCYQSPAHQASLFCLFIAFFCLIASAIYFLQHVNYAPSLKSAFKPLKPSS